MKSNAMKMYKHLIIAVVIGLIILLAVQPVNGLTVIGVRTLAVMIPTLYLWLTVGTTWTSLLFLGFLVMTGAMTSTEVWAGSVGHFSVISMIVFMMLNYCLTETGVIDLVCSWFITRKIVNNRPYVFLCMFFASMMILGMFMDNLSLAVIYVGIAVVLAEKLGLKKGQPFYTCMFMGIMWVDTVISIASPIAHAPCLILMGYMSTQLGIDVSYGQWLAVGVPFAILMFIVIIICVNIWRPDTSAYINYDVEAEKTQYASAGYPGQNFRRYIHRHAVHDSVPGTGKRTSSILLCILEKRRRYRGGYSGRVSALRHPCGRQTAPGY